MLRRLSPILLAASACVSPTPVDVQLVDPCNQQSISAVQYLRFEPRGTDVMTGSLTTILETSAGSAPEIPIPLTSDFQMIVTGHRDDFDAPASAIGVSARFDLVGRDEPVAIRVPLAQIDRFYDTTDLAEPASCSRMNVPRYGATATHLPRSGAVLVVGGATVQDGTIEYRREVELYDPATGRFEVVARMPPGAERAFHTATLLADGRVLIAGGDAVIEQRRQSIASALVIDTRDITAIRVLDPVRMPGPRTGHQAVRLANGLVVLIGGRVLQDLQTNPSHTYLRELAIFDPVRGEFLDANAGTLSGAFAINEARYGHSATLLASGRDVMIAGGFNETGPVRTFEILRIDEGAIQVTSVPATGSAVGPIFHAATLDEDGRVLLAGGYSTVDDAEPMGRLQSNPSPNVEAWTFLETRGEVIKNCNGQMRVARGLHTVSVVPGGGLPTRVLFAGGRADDGRPTVAAEIATLVDGPSCFAASTELEMSQPRTEHVAVPMGTGEILLVGGRRQNPGDPFGESVAEGELFSPARRP
jgi:hypothetical protein